MGSCFSVFDRHVNQQGAVKVGSKIHWHGGTFVVTKNELDDPVTKSKRFSIRQGESTGTAEFYRGNLTVTLVTTKTKHVEKNWGLEGHWRNTYKRQDGTEFLV